MKGKVWTIIVLVVLLAGVAVFNGCKKSQPQAKPAKAATPTKAVEPNQPKK